MKSNKTRKIISIMIALSLICGGGLPGFSAHAEDVETSIVDTDDVASSGDDHTVGSNPDAVDEVPDATATITAPADAAEGNGNASPVEIDPAVILLEKVVASLPDVTKVYSSNLARVQECKDYYEIDLAEMGLQSQVQPETLAKIDALLERIALLLPVDAAISALPEPKTIGSADTELIEAVKAASGLYEDLGELKSQIGYGNTDKLNRSLSRLLALPVEELILALPDWKELAEENRAAVTDANTAYNALTDKSQVDSALAFKLQKLFNLLTTDYNYLYFDDTDTVKLDPIEVIQGTDVNEILKQLPTSLTVVMQPYTSGKYVPTQLDITEWNTSYYQNNMNTVGSCTLYIKATAKIKLPGYTDYDYFPTVKYYANKLYIYEPTIKVNILPKAPEATEGDLALSLDDGAIDIVSWNSYQGQGDSYRIRQNGQDITLKNGASITLSQKDSSVPSKNKVSIGNGVTGLTLNLNNVNLKATGSGNWMASSPIAVGKDSEVLVNLSGHNILTPGNFGAGIAVGARSKLTVDGDGSLLTDGRNASDAGGIGTYNNDPSPDNYATIAILGGVIEAYASQTSAAIGGFFGVDQSYPYSNDGGNILISGKDTVVTAIGGQFAAAIGGAQYGSGGNITIDGATVTASTGSSGAAIGGGMRSYSGAGGGSGNIVLTGGATITATGGYAAAAIGRGGASDNKEFPAASTDSITIASDVTIKAYANGTLGLDNKKLFAIDTGVPCAIGASVLNGRFLYGELPIDKTNLNHTNKIDVLSAGGELAASLNLPNRYNAFAVTVSAGDYLVQNGAEGKEMERADYTHLGEDASFLYKVGETDTTRDDLAFQAFTITATAGGNGKVSPAGATAASPLGTLKYTFTPDAGYTVDQISINGDELTGVDASATSYTFENIQSNQAIHVTFKRGATPPTPEIPDPDPTIPYVPTVPSIDEDITDEETPLAPGPDESIPDETVPTASPIKEETIADEAPPLTQAPQTGSRRNLLLGSLLTGALLAGATLLRRKERND